MAKPTITPRWADIPQVPDRIEEPNSAKKDVGFAPAERPPAEFLNWLFNLVYLWILYLQAGDLEGNTSIDGSLDILASHDVTIGDGNLTVNGDVTIQGGGIINEAGHGDRTLIIPAFAGMTDGDDITFTLGNSFAEVNNADGDLSIPVSMRAGQRVKGLSAYWEFSGGTSDILFHSIDLTNGVATVIDSASLPATVGVNELVLSFAPFVLVATESLRVVWSNTLVGSIGNRLYAIKVIYDKPAIV